MSCKTCWWKDTQVNYCCFYQKSCSKIEECFQYLEDEEE